VDRPCEGRSLECPECERDLPTYDHAEERAWRHLDSLQFLTYLHAQPPRVSCPHHGVRQVRLPWAEPMSRFTNLFERMAVDVLKECDVLGASRLLRTSWDETWHLMERAVARGQAVKEVAVPALVGVDEKASGRGHDYITVVSDLARGTVEYLADERKESSLDSYFEQFSTEGLAGIEAEGMDMWEPYANSVRSHLADADDKIVFDRYHIIKNVVSAVDTVRKQENRALVASGDKSLTGSKYLWLYSAENLPKRHQSRFDALRSGDLKTSRAWAIKENLRFFWDYHVEAGPRSTRRVGTSGRRIRDSSRSSRSPARSSGHLLGLLAFFDHRITSAGAEGLNSRIQAIRVSARGYRNRNNFKTAVYFHCGGLDLYSQTH
jgi:transposase